MRRSSGFPVDDPAFNRDDVDARAETTKGAQFQRVVWLWRQSGANVSLPLRPNNRDFSAFSARLLGSHLRIQAESGASARQFPVLGSGNVMARNSDRMLSNSDIIPDNRQLLNWRHWPTAELIGGIERAALTC